MATTRSRTAECVKNESYPKCAICAESFWKGADGVICGHPMSGSDDNRPIVRRWVCLHCGLAIKDVL